MKLTTYRFRLKDSACRNRLRKLGFGVNNIWNYCNEQTAYQWAFRRQLLSAFDLHKLTAGVGKDLGLHSQTVQAVVDEYTKCGKQFKRPKLNWRSRRRSLSWVPFKAVGVKIVADTVTYGGHRFRFWNSRPLPGKVRFGSFCEDAQGRWYVNFVCEDLTPERALTGKEVGVDMGLKTIATLSDGVELSRENLTKKFELQLAVAQRARKKKQARRIHAKIKHQRKDWNHKTTTQLTREYDVLVVGNVRSGKLKKMRFQHLGPTWLNRYRMPVGPTSKRCLRIKPFGLASLIWKSMNHPKCFKRIFYRHLLGLFGKDGTAWTKGVRSQNVGL